jgi:hypothetical protein
MDRNQIKKLEESLKVCIDNRKLEIELLWKRTTIFWGFLAALFIAVATVRENHSQLAFVFSTVGLIFSFIWTLSNRGSKSWQESWEIKAEYFFNKLYSSDDTKDIYQRVYDNDKDDKTFFLLRPRKYSLSRLLISLSDFTVVFWVGVCIYMFPINFFYKLPNINLREEAGVLFFILGILYCIYIAIATHSHSIGKTIKERFDNHKEQKQQSNRMNVYITSLSTQLRFQRIFFISKKLVKQVCVAINIVLLNNKVINKSNIYQ